MAEFDILTYPGAASSFSGPEFGAIAGHKRKRFGTLKLNGFPERDPNRRSELKVELT
jgi:hypothetical protein